MGKTLAVVLTSIGGIFYLMGALAATLLAAIFGAVTTLVGSTSANTAVNFVSAVFLLGIGSGLAIIIGGALVFASPKLRKYGAIIVIAMTVVGAVPTIGGFIIGFVLSLVGGILALTYKEKKLVTRIMNADGTTTTTTTTEEPLEN